MNQDENSETKKRAPGFATKSHEEPMPTLTEASATETSNSGKPSIFQKPDRKSISPKLKGLSADNDTVLEYHPFAAITRWRNQQEGALLKDLKVILLFAVPVCLGCFFLACGFLEQFEQESASRRYAVTRENQQEKIAIEINDYRSTVAKKFDPILKDLPELRNCHVNLEMNSKGYIFSRRLVQDNGKAPSKAIMQSINSMEFMPTPPLFLNARYPLRVELAFPDTGSVRLKFLDLENPVADGTKSTAVLNASRKEKYRIAQEETEASRSIVDYFCFGGIGLFLGSLFFVSSKPTQIGINRNGWRFLWRRRFKKKNGKYLEWSKLKRIYMDRPKNSTSPLNEKLCFQTHENTVHEIKMGSLEAVEDREILLKAIEKWAPSVARDPSVIQALQPPADHSYTELWLQALSAPPKRERLKPLLPGTKLKNGKYKIVDQIGAGGQGMAYLASNEQGQTSVLKECILPVYVDVNVRRSSLEQFENEARLLRQIDHPQIVKLIDFFVEDHRTYLVLEHIDGLSLRQIVKSKGALAEQQVRELSQQMCAILKCLHGLNPPVIHRDFTPDNLILSRDGTLKLIDFNVAKQVVESTTSGTVVGKHAYLPPEQFRGMAGCASDIYAMGATLYFLLCGKDPEPISTSHPRQICSNLSDTINSVVERATALDLKKRYKSIQELFLDLNQ